MNKEIKIDEINKNFNGLLVVKARNGNFNAGFDGNPRTLPDGTIFATDKALKYCIREYFALFEELPVFVRRSRDFQNGKDKKRFLGYESLEKNMESKVNLLQDLVKDEKCKIKSLQNKEFFAKLKIEEIYKDEEMIVKVLKEFIDVRLFGVVFSPKGKGVNISYSGPVQISYGLNKLFESGAYPVQILSPYTNETVSNPDPRQPTIGEENRSDEIYYVYNLSVNKTNAKHTGMSYSDLELFKKALMNSVDTITSCTKYGCESVALIWLNNKEDIVLNNLDEFIDIEKEEGIVYLKLSRLKQYLEQFDFKEVSPQKYNLNFDYSEKAEDQNKIQVIYKDGKVKIV